MSAPLRLRSGQAQPGSAAEPEPSPATVSVSASASPASATETETFCGAAHPSRFCWGGIWDSIATPSWFPLAAAALLVLATLLLWRTLAVDWRHHLASLTLGLLMSVLVGFALRLAQQARTRARQFQAANFLLQNQIEQRRRLSEALQQERQRLSEVLNLLPAYVVLLSQDYHVPFANRYFEERFGKAEGRLCYEYLFQRDAPCESCESFQAFHTGVPHHWEWLGPDGRTYDISDFPFLDHDGTPLVLEMGIDVTARKQAERRLYDQQFYARSLIEASLDPLMTTDAHGVITDVNQQMESLTGCPRSQLIGSHFKRYCTQPERAEAGIRQVLAEGKVVDFELTVRRRVPLSFSLAGPPDTETGTATQTIVAYNATLFRDWEGNVAGVFAAARDITERKRAQDQLQRYAAELARSNAELQDFASIASHDLQEPLRKVLAFGDRLQQHCTPAASGQGSQLDDLGRDFLARMQNAAARMSNLIEALLEYSRVSSRAQPFQPLDLQPLLAEVLADLEARIQQTQANVEVGPMPRLLADRTQIRQLLQNLLANALKFHRPGAAPQVRVNSRALGNAWWEITVADDGIGFEERYVERIFRPFQRLHGRSEYEGSGMGLAICRKIVARHGGEITARSQPGQGATFVVTLPALPVVRSP